MEDKLRMHDISLLENAMKNKRFPHGIVLESNKSRILQKYIKLICQWAVCREKNSPCGKCNQCIKVSKGVHPDIYTAKLLGKSEIVNIDEIRNICNDVYIKPNESNTKIYIIPNADKMQIKAQNAFLKVLEEPPQNVIFILCCSNSQGLLKTILSRTNVYRLDNTYTDSDVLDKVNDIALKIIETVPENKGYKLLCATSKISDRISAKNVIDVLLIKFHNALKVAALKDYDLCDETEKSICEKINIKNIFSIIEILNTAKDMLNSNINMSLFSVWLCAELRSKR